jgi:hypothetical protein
MQTHTVEIVTATLKADISVPASERNRILKLIRGESEPVQNDNGRAPKIFSREQAAQLLGDKTERYIDQLCKRGLLQKFIPPGNVRAIGVTASSLNQFLGSGA